MLSSWNRVKKRIAIEGKVRLNLRIEIGKRPEKGQKRLSKCGIHDPYLPSLTNNKLLTW